METQRLLGSLSHLPALPLQSPHALLLPLRPHRQVAESQILLRCLILFSLPPGRLFLAMTALLIPILRPFFTETQAPISARTSDHPRTLSRRDALSLSSASVLLFSLSPTDPAFAFGISGPKEWLKDQKKKSSRFLLAPIDASRESLRSVYLSLTTRESDYTDKDLESLQNLLRSSARDCVPKERSSIVDFQSKTGVEVCTFKLVLKNAASLLDDKDPVILKAENILNDLARSFGSLIVLTNGIDMNLPSDRKKIADAVMEAISYLDKFEKSVKDCLEI